MDTASRRMRSPTLKRRRFTHAVFIRDTEDLPSAPFPRAEKVDPEDEGSVYPKVVGTVLKNKTQSLK
ncbi:MAG: hypothetical protein ACKPKO_55555, partial [Candidatus Fonsibacter sp.]